MSTRRHSSLVSATAMLDGLRASIRVLRWGFLLLVIAYIASGVTMVGPNESALVLRFGKLQPDIHQPGLLLALPPPIDEVIRVPTRAAQELSLQAWTARRAANAAATNDVVLTLHPVRDGYTLTGDANIVQGQFVLRYQIADPVAFTMRAQQHDRLLAAIAYRAMTGTLAGMRVDDALTTGRDQVRQEATRRAQQQCDALDLGIQIAALELRELSPAQPVLPAFQEVSSAQVEAQTILQQAHSYRAQILPQAGTEAYRMRSEAESAAQTVIARAEGEAASFLAMRAQYQRNPGVTRARLMAETIADVAPRLRSTTVMPTRDGRTTILLTPKSNPARTSP